MHYHKEKCLLERMEQQTAEAAGLNEKGAMGEMTKRKKMEAAAVAAHEDETVATG